MSGADQKLPQREASLFKKVLRSYEQKQYKAGLKFSKQILQNSKCEQHGETLCMKGLLLSYLGKGEEGMECVKRGLKYNLQSYVCWHVFGLVHRGEKEYGTAIKAYVNALRIEKDNQTVLRDLAILQVHVRDFEGFCDTRHKLLLHNGGRRGSWVGYGIACHLLNDYDTALQVMSTCRHTEGDPAHPDPEASEMRVYELQLLIESGRKKEALEFIDSQAKHILDKVWLWKTKAELLIEMNRCPEAQILYTQLLSANPDNSSYIEGLEKCLEVHSPETRLDLYRQLREKHSRSQIILIRTMSILPIGSELEKMLDEYLRKNLNKGMPPLWNTLKFMCANDPKKVTVVDKLVTGYIQQLEQCHKFHPDDTQFEPPTTYVWVLYFIAALRDWQGKYTAALELINKLLEHTPTHIEAYMMKARILKHSGNPAEAAKAIDEGREQDTADRFINNKCSKYLLRAEQVDLAVVRMSEFIKEGRETLEHLNDYQTTWFQIELARTYIRQDRRGNALRYCHQIVAHFEEFFEDQLDFHAYCIRKNTLSTYIQLLRLEDNLRSHNYYFEAATMAVEIYLSLYDRAYMAQEGEDMLEHMTPDMIKKRKKKQLKEQAKKNKQSSRSASIDAGKSDSTGEDGKEPDKFEPNLLASTKEPLKEAMKLLTPLQTFATRRIKTHALAYELYKRKQKLLLMAQAVKRGMKIDPDDPDVHKCIIDFTLQASSVSEADEPLVSKVLRAELSSILPDTDPLNYTREFLNKHQNSMPHLIVGILSLHRLQPDNLEENLENITLLDEDIQGITLDNCIQVCRLLENKTFGECSSQLEEYRKKCKALFPLSTFFNPTPIANNVDPASNQPSQPDQV